MSDAQTETTVYDEISEILRGGKDQNETAEEFKKRALQHINGFDDRQYDALPVLVREWVHDASRQMARNNSRSRPQSLPAMSGLDKQLRRFDITKPFEKPAPGKTRKKGEDAISRVASVLSQVNDPENVKVDDLKDMIKQRYPEADYGQSALKQGMHAFLTVRRVLGVGNTQQRQAAE
jgi:hypothetical protein